MSSLDIKLMADNHGLRSPTIKWQSNEHCVGKTHGVNIGQVSKLTLSSKHIWCHKDVGLINVMHLFPQSIIMIKYLYRKLTLENVRSLGPTVFGLQLIFSI